MRSELRNRAAILFPIALTLALCTCGGNSSNSANSSPTSQSAPAEVLFATTINGIQSYSLNPSTGALTASNVTQTAFTSIAISANLASDPLGHFLFVFDVSNSAINVFSISSGSTTLSAVSGSPFSVSGIGAGNIAVSPSGKFLYAARTNGLVAFSLNSTTGVLNLIAGSPFSDGSVLRAAVVDPMGKFLYGCGNATISVFAIDSGSGALTPISGSPFPIPTTNAGFNIALHPSGNFLYVPVVLDGTIAAWAIDRTTGALTSVPGSPFNAGIHALNAVVDPSGKFLYAYETDTGTVGLLSVASNGALTPTSSALNVAPAQSVLIDPSGKFLYAAGQSGIIGYNIDSATGTLNPFNGPALSAPAPDLMTIVNTH